MENKSQPRVLTTEECKQVAGGSIYIKRVGGNKYFRPYLGKRPGRG